jgi:hypothetical protein
VAKERFFPFTRLFHSLPKVQFATRRLPKDFSSHEIMPLAYAWMGQNVGFTSWQKRTSSGRPGNLKVVFFLILARKRTDFERNC